MFYVAKPRAGVASDFVDEQSRLVTTKCVRGLELQDKLLQKKFEASCPPTRVVVETYNSA